VVLSRDERLAARRAAKPFIYSGPKANRIYSSPRARRRHSPAVIPILSANARRNAATD
jgi:hypothetical protein